MSLQKTMLAAMSKFISVELNKQVEVTHFTESVPSGFSSGCDTCGYGAEEYSIEIWYTDDTGRGRIYTYEQGLSQLLVDLDRV